MCRDVGITSDLFESRGEMTVHTKKHHGCYNNPHGDWYVPIPPDQLAEGRARAIARQVERDRRQQRREQPDYWHPEIVIASLLPPRGCGRGVHHIQAILIETTSIPGQVNAHVSLPTPSVGRACMLVERDWRHVVATPTRSHNTYPLLVVPSVSVGTSVSSVSTVSSVSAILPVPSTSLERPAPLMPAAVPVSAASTRRTGHCVARRGSRCRDGRGLGGSSFPTSILACTLGRYPVLG